MEDFNEVTTTEVNDVVVEDTTTEEAGFNPLVIGIGLGALAVLGANLMVKKVIKPMIQKHRDKKATPDVVDATDYDDAVEYDDYDEVETEK